MSHNVKADSITASPLEWRYRYRSIDGRVAQNLRSLRSPESRFKVHLLASLRLSDEEEQSTSLGNLKLAQTNTNTPTMEQRLVPSRFNAMQIQNPVNTSHPADAERIFHQDDRWYFNTDQGERIGPFRFRSEAESGFERFMENLRNKL